MTVWCDAGVNLFSEQFDHDRTEVLLRAAEHGIKRLVLIGSNIAETQQNIQLCHTQPQCKTTAGVHPHQAAAVSTDWLMQLEQLAAHSAVAAIGECGLDFNRDFSPRPQQLKVFAEQLQLAIKLAKPVYLHERDAFDTQVALLKEQQINAGIAHCFTGDTQQLKTYLDLGLYIGITGWVCDERRGQALQQAIRFIPADRLLLETDAPYLLPRNLTPKPRSRRNEPAMLTAIATKVAEIRQCSIAELAAQCWHNSSDLFGFTKGAAQ